MTKLKFILTILFVCVIFLGSCGNNDDETPTDTSISCECKEKEIVKVLKNEPAYIRYSVVVESFTFELVTHYNELLRSDIILPCNNDIPLKYKKNGLPVKISGNVIQSKLENMPEARLIQFNLLDLTSIENRKE